ncbi:MAG: lysophospholipid acyltransferase family protein [Candidatus Puniceispirillales bacterium WSBS_2018_MAG_OTU23]
MMKPALKFLRHKIGWPIEAALFYLLVGVLTVMPPPAASALMGGLMWLVGPLTAYHRRSLFNIGFAMPELSPQARRKICRGMWVNLGRSMGEFFHIKRLMTTDHITVEGAEHIEAFRGIGGFYIGAHIGNWELGPFPLINAGLPISCVYRPINNPYVAAILKRRMLLCAHTYEKGVEGARGMIASINRKDVFGMVVDQKLREGEMLDFFGHKASTAVAHLKIAHKKNLPIVMSQVIRTKGCHFKIILTPLDLSTFDPASDDYINNAGTHINSIFEHWIRQNPEQWLWAHRRWPESKGEVYTPENHMIKENRA